jgi:hypothetical protein
MVPSLPFCRSSRRRRHPVQSLHLDSQRRQGLPVRRSRGMLPGLDPLKATHGVNAELAPQAPGLIRSRVLDWPNARGDSLTRTIQA